MLTEIEKRRSIRKYSNQDIADELLKQLLESARYAPSGSNTQPWKFLIVRDKLTKEKIVAADNNQNWMLDAPVFIVCAADISSRIKTTDLSTNLNENCALPELKLIIRDTSIAIEHIILEAQHLGLGTCWTAWFTQSAIKKAVNAPDNFYICAVLTIGYAAEQPAMRPRKNISKFVFYEDWH